MARATIHFDGSCWPNPGGVARAGWTIEFDDRRLLNGSKVIAKVGTNNIAEWGALVESLREAVSNGADSVDIFGDSKLVINGLNGIWRQKSPHLKQYKAAAYSILENLLDWSATWIPREENGHADRLSTDGIYHPLPYKKGVSRHGDVRHSQGVDCAQVIHSSHAMVASAERTSPGQNDRGAMSYPTVSGTYGAAGRRDSGGSTGMSALVAAGYKYVHAARETVDGFKSAAENGLEDPREEKSAHNVAPCGTYPRTQVAMRTR